MGPREYVKHLQESRPTIAQIFDEYIPAAGPHGSPRPINLDDVIVKNAGYWQSSTLDLIPSRLELSRTLKNPTGKERRLAKALSRVSDQYDLILIDCAPTESILTDAAYFSSRYAIVPVKPEFMATIGLPLLARSIQDFQAENDDHDIEMGAALLRRGVFALFMGLFARGCVSPVLISGGQQPSQRVPASFRRPAEPRNGAEHRRSVPLGRAPFWTFTRRSGTVPWEGRQACDGCDDRIPATYIRRAANRRPLHRSPEPSPVRSGRCCLRGCQSPPLVQRSPADERERTRTGTAPAGPGFGTQAPARTSRPTQPERGCWSGRGHQRCRVLRAARARKPRRNGLRHDAGCGSGLRAARSRRLASARCRAEPAAGALLGRDAPPRDHRDRLAGTTAYALEATVVLDIIHVAAATRRAVLVAGSSKGLSAFGPRPDGSRPARGDTWLQLRRSSAAAGSRSLDAY